MGQCGGVSSCCFACLNLVSIVHTRAQPVAARGGLPPGLCFIKMSFPTLGVSLQVGGALDSTKVHLLLLARCMCVGHLPLQPRPLAAPCTWDMRIRLVYAGVLTRCCLHVPDCGGLQLDEPPRAPAPAPY